MHSTIYETVTCRPIALSLQARALAGLSSLYERLPSQSGSVVARGYPFLVLLPKRNFEKGSPDPGISPLPPRIFQGRPGRLVAALVGVYVHVWYVCAGSCSGRYGNPWHDTDAWRHWAHSLPWQPRMESPSPLFRC